MKKRITVFLNLGERWNSRAEYVLRTFADYAGLMLDITDDETSADIICGDPEISLLKLSHKLDPSEIFSIIPHYYKMGEKEFPVFYGDDPATYLIENAFLFLSDIQSYAIKERDDHDRISYSDSLQKKYDIQYPIVEEYFDLFLAALKKSGVVDEDHITKKERILNSGIRGTLSHDIDIVRRYPKFPSGAIKYYLKKFSIKWVKEICGYLRERYLISPDMLHRIEKAEKKQGMSSTFFVIPISTHKKDNKLNMGIIIDEIRKLSDDMEIGLHYPYETLSDPEKHLNSSISELSSASLKVSGARAHYLRTDIKVLRALEQAGIEYDSSLAFAQMSGYRNGVSFPFKMYDIEKEASMNMWQIPLTSMDQSFIGYGGRTLKEFFSNELESPPTAFSHILVHNYNILNTRRSINLYKDFLVNLKKSGKYVTLTEYLSEWKSVSG